MKRLRKGLALGLGAAMMLALAACGNNATTTTTTKAPENTTTPVVTQSESTDTTTTPATEEGGRIVVYTRDSASGTRGAFEEIVDFKGELTDTALETSGNGDMAQKVGADVHGIGYVSLTTDFKANNLRPLDYNGVSAVESFVLDGSYKLARPFMFLTRAKGDFVDDRIEQLTMAFVAFMTESNEGIEAVYSGGGIVDLSAGKPWAELKKDHPIVDGDNSDLTLRTGGSTSVEKVLTAALETFQPLAGQFQFAIGQTGSGDGWKRTIGDEKDGPNAAEIGFASRAFSEKEILDDSAAHGTMCQDAVVVVVSADHPGTGNVSQEQLKAIYTGEITDWSELN